MRVLSESREVWHSWQRCGLRTRRRVQRRPRDARGGGGDYVGVNPDPELRIFLEHFLIPLRRIGSGHSILSLPHREGKSNISEINPVITLTQM